MFQFEASNNYDSFEVTICDSKEKGGNSYVPYVFTEQHVAMLSGVINSDNNYILVNQHFNY